MGHYAKVKNGIVTRVIVADESFIATYKDGEEGNWIKTSYNTYGGKHYNRNTNELSYDQSKALRKNYAGIGYTYDEVKDAFIPPQPFNSWILNEDTCLWNPPTPCPQDKNLYIWNEDILNWEKIIIKE